MNELVKHITVPVSAAQAFDNFVNSLGDWWPPAYTWSQDQLQTITIEGKENGLCTEIGPYGFRCDWGRVLAFEANRRICFTWQISPERVPEPNPEQASVEDVTFTGNDSATQVTLTHRDFEKHGEGATAYQQAMASEQGWEYLLTRYQSYCEHPA